MRILTLAACRQAGLLACLLAGCGDGGKLTEAGKSNTGIETAPSPAVALPEGCVLPTLENVNAGKYAPLSRPLFLYVSKKSLEKPHIRAFVSYYLTEEGQDVVTEIGRLKTSPGYLEESLAAIGGPYSPPDDAPLKGAIHIDGSSSVFPFSQGVAEEFRLRHDDVTISVGLSGTGGGFKKFIRGETDISDASRPISPSEAEEARNSGVEYIQVTVAMDAITVVVSPRNKFCHCLSVEQLRRIWEPDSKVTKWSDINESFPDAEIHLYGADSDSGTFDYFTEVIVGKAKSSRSDYNPSADDNQLVSGIESDPFALGYLPFSYYIENEDRLRAVAIKPLVISE